MTYLRHNYIFVKISTISVLRSFTPLDDGDRLRPTRVSDLQGEVDRGLYVHIGVHHAQNYADAVPTLNINSCLPITHE